MKEATLPQNEGRKRRHARTRTLTGNEPSQHLTKKDDEQLTRRRNKLERDLSRGAEKWLLHSLPGARKSVESMR